MKEKITAASVKLFEKKGFSETSIQDIVDELGVTKGTFYYYFSSKEELLMDIHQRYIDELLLEQERIVRVDGSACKAKLLGIVHLILRYIEHQGPSARVFFREMRHLSGERLQEIMLKRDRLRLNVERLIREGISLGEFRLTIRPDIAAFALLGMTNWSYQWFNPKGELSAEDVSRLFVDMLMHGIESPQINLEGLSHG